MIFDKHSLTPSPKEVSFTDNRPANRPYLAKFNQFHSTILVYIHSL